MPVTVGQVMIGMRVNTCYGAGTVVEVIPARERERRHPYIGRLPGLVVVELDEGGGRRNFLYTELERE